METPDINIIEVETTREVFEAVISGEADAGMDTAITLQYITAQEYTDEITVHQGVDFSPAELPTGLHFMVNRQNTGLTNILNRALENLSDSHHQALVDKWFNSINMDGNPQAFRLVEQNSKCHAGCQPDVVTPIAAQLVVCFANIVCRKKTSDKY